MQEIAGFPFFEVEFTKDGEVFNQSQVDDLLAAVGGGTITDLFVISHGWNNDKKDARDLYQEFFARVREAINTGTLPGALGRGFAVAGIYWPSKRFADSELIPGGGAVSVHNEAAQVDALKRQLEDLKGAFDAPDADAKLDEAKKLVSRLENSLDVQDEFVAILRGLFPEDDELEEAIPEQFYRDPGREILDRLSIPLDEELDLVPPEPGMGAATSIGDISLSSMSEGEAAGLGDFLDGIKQGARNLLNFTTYYTMKKRAGLVGRNGVSALLRQLRAKKGDLKLHLIGHSFGGRVVTAAADGVPGQAPVKVNTMTLLQAAFSHNGFSENYDGRGSKGFFCAVVRDGKVSGPVLISHSVHDKAVGIAYPLASRIVGDAANGLGDENDKFGGMGRNGAQHTDKRVVGNLLPVSQTYLFEGGRLYNLNADAYIKGHSDICKPEVVHALLQAIETT